MTKSGGKPTFLTVRLFDLLNQLALKVYLAKITINCNHLEVRKAGLPPLFVAEALFGEASLRGITYDLGLKSSGAVWRD